MMYDFPLFKNFMFVFIMMISWESSNQNEVFSYRDRKLLTKDYSICKEAQLQFTMVKNFAINTLTVQVKLTDLKFKDCFTHYKLFLKRKYKTVQAKEISYVYEEQNKDLHTFENVTCGLYTVVVKPCYTDLQCSNLDIYTDINMTSKDCYASRTSLSQSYFNISIEIVIILAIVSIISCLLLALIGFKYRCCLTDRSKLENTKEVIYKPVKTLTDRIPCKNIHVFIFHHYSKILKEEVDVLRDFIIQYFNKFVLSVKGIEDELPFFHIELNHWFEKVLSERNSDGSLNKIILINSNKDYEEEEFELENDIFSEIIKRLSDDTSRCLTGYNNLFVVQLGEDITYSEKFKNIVKRQRYHIPKHLNELCLNLCSATEC